MPLHATPTVRSARLTRLAALAASCIVAGGAAIAVADIQHPAQAEAASGAPATPYFDLEANKARSMRALGIYLVARHANPMPPYRDLELNKARSQEGR